MSSNTQGSGSAADSVRQGFAGLPFEEKIPTLIRIELDMLGDAVEGVVSAVSRVVDDIAKACDSAGERASTTPEAGGKATSV